MSKSWQAYALHILDAIDKIDRIGERGSIVEDVILYDATLRNLQTLSEATQSLPDQKKRSVLISPGKKLAGFATSLFITIWGTLIP
jgi:uncharacterized protein with HEPN domain